MSYRRVVIFLVAVPVSLLADAVQAQQGTLQSWRQASRSPDRATPSRSSRSSSDYFDDDDDDDDTFLGSLLGSILDGIFSGGSSESRSREVYDDIDATPVEDDESINSARSYLFSVAADDDDIIGSYANRLHQEATLRTRFEYQDDFDSIWQLGFHTLFEPVHNSIALDSEVNFWREQVGSSQHDELWTGDLNLVIPVLSSERFVARFGAGMNWLSDRIGTEFGINATVAMDWFIADPWILSGEMDFGSIGNSELFHGRFTAGILYKHVEFYTGFDYFEIGNFDSRQLVGGIRLWF